MRLNDYEYVILHLFPKLGRIFTISERFSSPSTAGRIWIPHEELRAHCERKGRATVLFPTRVHTQASASVCFLHGTSKFYDEEEI